MVLGLVLHHLNGILVGEVCAVPEHKDDQDIHFLGGLDVPLHLSDQSMFRVGA
jgi:hypothetical protein